MKRVLQFFIAYFFKIALWFRYRITIKGLENLNKKNLNKPGGILFLPNHPAYFVDPVSTFLATYPKFTIRPMMVEYMYYLPGVNWLSRLIGAIPVPNFYTSTNSLKKKRNEEIIQTVSTALSQGENFLIYPAGRVKYTSYEAIGGASAVHRIVQNVPEANIVLMRVKGLYGSIFSRALTGKAVPMFPTIWKGVKIALKNLIFFSPRREITIEIHLAPPDFPYHASRLEFNRYLERWYNQPDGLTAQEGPYPGDSLILVSYSMWKKQLPKIEAPKKTDEKAVSLDDIPDEIKDKVYEKLTELTKLPRESIKPEMDFAADLGLDSLDVAELSAFLHNQFNLKGVPVLEIGTVGRLMGLAGKVIPYEEQTVESHVNTQKWLVDRQKVRAQIAPGKTMIEAFLNNAKRMGKAPAAADATAGVMSYSDITMRVILMAEYIRHLPGTYVGILLPAAVGSYVLTLACQLAGKIPLMVNWTVGPRHIDSVLKLSNVQSVLTAWSFMDRLDNVDLNGMEDNLILLEDVRKDLSLRKKLNALFLSKRSTEAILKHFQADKIQETDPAVLLFTSGSEGMPKGVPLSHKNILSNQRAILEYIELYTTDTVLGILPPFHSFGFTVTGFLSLLSGMKVGFSPDPTDGKRMAADFERYKATIMCGAPSFIKSMLKEATASQVESMRICVTGAEKPPPELFLMVDKVGKKGAVVEGYGITECSPIITANQPDKPHRGVGKAIPGVELLIVHPETKEILPQGEQGMLLTRGPNVFSGYLNPGLSSPFVEVGGATWYKTGDLGYLDKEGNLYISGRLKRFVKVGGEMVSLTAIEEVLLTQAPLKKWPLSEEGATLAICAKEIPGEKPIITLFALFKTNVDEVNQVLREAGFSNLVKVSTVIPIKEIPLMGTGKINYRILESTLESQS